MQGVRFGSFAFELQLVERRPLVDANVCSVGARWH